MKSENKSWGILGQALAVLTLTVALAGCGGSSDAGSAGSTAVSGAGTAAATPVVSGTLAATVAANNRYSFQPTVANPSGTPLSFGIQNKPTWATFGETTGELSGTPAATDADKYSNIVITANDGTTTSGLPAFSIQVTPAGSSPASSSSSSSGASSGSSSSGAASVASGLSCGGLVWTVVNGVVAKGGVADTSTSQVTNLVCVNNVAYQFSTVPTFGGWYGWIGGKWVLQAGDPRTAASSSSSSSSSSSAAPRRWPPPAPPRPAPRPPCWPTSADCPDRPVTSWWVSIRTIGTTTRWTPSRRSLAMPVASRCRSWHLKRLDRHRR